MQFSTKPIRRYPPHLTHVATLPWEIKKIKFSAYIRQIWILSAPILIRLRV